MNNEGNNLNFNQLSKNINNTGNLFFQKNDSVFLNNQIQMSPGNNMPPNYNVSETNIHSTSNGTINTLDVYQNIPNEQNINTTSNVFQSNTAFNNQYLSNIQTTNSQVVASQGFNNTFNNQTIVNKDMNNNNSFVDLVKTEEVVDNIKEKNGNSILLLLSNKKILCGIAILIFIFTSITVVKAFYLRSKVEDYEDFYMEVEQKLSEEVIIYQDEIALDENLKQVAATELINCINSSVDINKLPSSVTSVINEINRYYNQSNNHFAFKYKDLFTGFSVSYNAAQNIFTASTIKAPKDIYIYEMASMGKVNLDNQLTYTSRYANTGAWELKKKRFNTKHDIRTLARYSTVASDNAAHNMLMDHFGRNNMLEFWKAKGTTAIFTAYNNWGVTNANDATIYMEELYRFYLEDDVYGQELMNNFLNSYPKFIKGKNNYKIASKSGWAGTAIHDVSLIFADNPYIVVALSNLGETGYYTSYFNTANDLAYKLHTEYWKYKMDMCGNINQY